MKKLVPIVLVIAAVGGVPAVARRHGRRRKCRPSSSTTSPRSGRSAADVSIDGPVSHGRFAPAARGHRPSREPERNDPPDPGRRRRCRRVHLHGAGPSGTDQGEVYRPGTVGVFLLPDEESIVKVFEEKGLMQFSSEVNAPGVSGASPYFTSTASRIQVAFPATAPTSTTRATRPVTVNLVRVP